MTATRHINPAGLDLVKSSEGLRLQAYQDTGGIWTIGYGHTLGVSPGMVITEAQATDFLRQDLAAAEGFVREVTADVATSDGQFSAMVSLTFNIGAGGFKRSTVLRMHRQGNYPAAGNAFLLWDKGHVDGQLVVLKGLLRRRNDERFLYLGQGPVVAPPPVGPDPDHSANDLNRAELERINPRR
jgi:lysozyme